MNNEDLAFWLSWCIEEYSAEKKLQDFDVASLFEKKGILEYLFNNAEILHTQGKNYIISQIDELLKK